MARVGFQQNHCPRFLATEGIKMLNGRWKVPILMVLGETTLRYADLRRALPEISHKMLAQQLQALERDGLISRREIVADPPKAVEYALTKLGSAARPTIAALTDLGRILTASTR